MLRIRWSDPESGDQPAPFDWRIPALITATLFLNFRFWNEHGLDFAMPVPRLAGVVVAAALLLTAMFFLGPALTTHAKGRRLFASVESSMGSIPAVGLRLCCALFLMRWIALLLQDLPFLFLPKMSSAKAGLSIAAILAFLFVTSLQTVRTNAKLAQFTNRLALTILVAALIRTREGLPATMSGIPDFWRPTISDQWHGLASLAFHVGPLAFLAADFVCLIKDRKQVLMVAAMGLVLPISGTLLVVGVIDVATLASRLYQPSLAPTVAMALWSHVRGS